MANGVKLAEATTAPQPMPQEKPRNDDLDADNDFWSTDNPGYTPPLEKAHRE